MAKAAVACKQAPTQSAGESVLSREHPTRSAGLRRSLHLAQQALIDQQAPGQRTPLLGGLGRGRAFPDGPAFGERLGLTRHIWHLPLFFVALAVLFGATLGLALSP